MSGLLATLSRELRAYFVSPLAYVILTLFLAMNGVFFLLIVSYLSDPRAGGSITPLRYYLGDALPFWLALLFIVPVLTMRLLAEERRSGTLESLMTSAVTEAQVVLGKYLAALAFYVFLWLPTVAYAVIVARYSAVDWGPVAGGYLGVLLIGALFLAIGVFGSALTKNQIVAAMVTFAILIGLFILIFLDGLLTGSAAKTVLGHLNVVEHMSEFNKGIVDTRRLVYYLSSTFLFLFLATRILAAKKWR